MTDLTQPHPASGTVSGILPGPATGASPRWTASGAQAPG